MTGGSHRGAFTTQRAQFLYRKMAEHLGLDPEMAEEYWPGFYEMYLMDQLDYINVVEKSEPHCLIGSLRRAPSSEHDYLHHLPESTVTRLLNQMRNAHAAWERTTMQEKVAAILDQRRLQGKEQNSEQKEENAVSV